MLSYKPGLILKIIQTDSRGDDGSQNALLLFHQTVGVDDGEVKLRAHGQILLQYPGLENAKAFLNVRRQAQVHACFKVFELRSALHDAIQRSFQIRFEKENNVRRSGKVVNPPNPSRRATTHSVAGKSGVDIAVAKNDVSGAKQRNKLPLIAVGKVRGVNEAKSRWRQQSAVLSLAGRGLHQNGRIPLAEKNADALLL